MKISTKHRPKWWLDTIKDYEKTFLDCRFSWPNDETMQQQFSEKYGFTVDPIEFSWIEFNSEKDLIWFILNFGVDENPY